MGRDLEEMTSVESPTHEATYEMETNVIDTGLGVLKYLETGDPQYREQVENNASDFENFKAEYDSLVETSTEEELGIRIGLLYEEYKTLGNALMDAKDDRDAQFSEINGNFEEADGIIDEEIQAGIDPGGRRTGEGL
jgi:hypothetical protein